MYAWGGDTRDWRGSGTYDYGSARAKYDKTAADAGLTGSRDYSRKRAPDMKLVDPRGKVISSDSTDPIIIGVDVTGSMASWPGQIFDRLPLLYQTLAKYRPDAEFAFAAIGDATVDSYPLQVSNFSKDPKELEKIVRALGCEGGGGGHITESYELFGYFMKENCKTLKATSPFLLIYGDEHFYDGVDPKQVKRYIGSELQNPLPSKQLWQDLMQQFNLYFLQKPYGSSSDNDITAKVKEVWADALGRQRVIDLSSMDRAVDVSMGLIAKHWGEYGDFTKSLDARHDDPSVKKGVHHSLRHIDADPPVKSVMKTTASKVTAPLA